MSDTIDIILLLALPASGKSEVRRYLDSLDHDRCRADFHVGPTVQLDDFPYVHVMRRVDQELIAKGRKGVFFKGLDRSFVDPKDWGTLIQLLNEDYADMIARRVTTLEGAGRALLERLDSASVAAGAEARMARLPDGDFDAVASAIDAEAREMAIEKHAGYPDTLEGRTVVMEFARGGADGSTMPLDPPFGYAHSLSMLSEEILERASILYIWVTPEESRRKNDDRADPDDPGSILHHGVPMEVMLGDYGCDDIEWLIERSDRENTVRVEAHGRVFHLPVGRFDNRVDKTSFVRGDQSGWTPSDVEALHRGIKEATDRLAAAGGLS